MELFKIVGINGSIESDSVMDMIPLEVVYYGDKVELVAFIESDTKDFSHVMAYNSATGEEIEDDFSGNEWVEIHNFLEERGFIVCCEVERESEYFQEALEQMEQRKMIFNQI